MGALTLNHVNAMPAATWHQLHMNETTVDVPEGLEAARSVVVEADEALLGPQDAFDAAVAAAQAELDAANAKAAPDARAILQAVHPDVDPHDLDIPALSVFEKRAVEEEMAQSIAGTFECALGDEAAAYLEEVGGAREGRTVLATKAGATERATIRVNGIDGKANVACVDIVAAENSTITLDVAFDSPDADAGVIGLYARVFASKNARVNVATIHTLGQSWLALDGEGYIACEDARIQVDHRVLGAGQSYTGLACDLRGDRSDATIRTRYLGHGDERRDFNYIVRHRGKKTTCNLDANGVLADRSRKVLRGTIDLVHGCKGAEGTERETVLLADEKVVNKTIPTILCDEDDVAGNHGATIGHVRPEQMNYLMTRGISQEAAERLFANATLEEAAINAPDAQVRASVARLAAELNVPFELVGTDEEAM